MADNHKLVDKPCVQCGKMMYGVQTYQKYCTECGHERLLESRRRYKQREKEKASKDFRFFCTPIKNEHTKYCIGCIYWGGNDLSCACCNYIFIKGHRRPCPPGKECTEKITRRKKRSKKPVEL